MTQDPNFLGVHLLPRGVSGNKKAVSPACVLTTPCGRNTPFPLQLGPQGQICLLSIYYGKSLIRVQLGRMYINQLEL